MEQSPVLHPVNEQLVLNIALLGPAWLVEEKKGAHTVQRVSLSHPYLLPILAVCKKKCYPLY